MERITTPKAPAAIGPYSQAYRTGDLLFTSGQVALDPETGEIVGSTIEEQARRCCESVGAILAEAGHAPRRVILKNLGKTFAPEGTVAQLEHSFGLDAQGIVLAVMEAMGK